jgi:serine/threonine protein phosphatase PrpC
MHEITAEFTREDLIAEVPLRVIPRVTVACKTDLGRVRENNEDKFEFYIPEETDWLAIRGLVFLVCDGMGGAAAGQIASELTCKTFIDHFYHHASLSPEEAAKAAVQSANRFVLDIGRAIPGRQGMGTTLSGLILCQDQAILVQVGDSRIYRLRDHDLQQLSEEHTFVEEQVRAGVITPQEAENHPYSHVLTKAIGVEEALEPQVQTIETQVGDTFLLCSDGLTNHVTDPEIAEIISQYSPAKAVWKLVNKAIAAGGSDNCTALLVRLDRLDPPQAGS